MKYVDRKQDTLQVYLHNFIQKKKDNVMAVCHKDCPKIRKQTGLAFFNIKEVHRNVKIIEKETNKLKEKKVFAHS